MNLPKFPKRKITVPHHLMDWTQSDSALARLYNVSRTRIGQIRKKITSAIAGKTDTTMETQTETQAPLLPAMEAAKTETHETPPQVETPVQALDIQSVVEAGERAFQGVETAHATDPVSEDASKSESAPTTDSATASNPAAAALFREVVVTSVEGGLDIAED